MTASLFVRAARREPTERTPIWLMRQAGRILPEYRALRERYSLIEICRRPELCAEVTLQPLARMPLDAAVLFADIMLPLVGIGVELELVDGVGPVIREPIRDARGVDALRRLDADEDVPFVLETVRIVKRELASSGRAVLGFCGAPFTLASYLIEGRPSREYARTKSLMYGDPKTWDVLMVRLADIAIAYLQAQAAAGADALQVFDSWVGALAPRDYVRFVQPHTRRLFAALKSAGVPLIHFGTNTTGLLDEMRLDGGTVIGVDWRVRLDDAWARIGHDLGIQGNLDPAVLLAPPEVMLEQAGEVLRRAGARPGHIFNLGHGVLPDTPLPNVQRLVDFVQSESAAQRVGAPVPTGDRAA